MSKSRKLEKTEKPNNWTTPEGQARTEARHVRIDQIRDARNAGIREGLLMALEVNMNVKSAAEGHAAIVARGDRHFGGTDWRK